MTDSTEAPEERDAPDYAGMSGAELQSVGGAIRAMGFTGAYEAKRGLAYGLAQLKINDVRGIRQRVAERREELEHEHKLRLRALDIIDEAIKTVLS